ncbi:uncharacterized protein LOC106077874 isoform X2 [Biomphalaria glabrata]|uniref:Uncharacterized protein LOC106077874 isoform X2 n=1 Tax=Biomphalaria glabrata TaxID=6526 RepID=A0A9W2YWD3_BIOGL|nr:uncharacterized protein LOC106077874 isoform X2 [Biomphalaria glabrata]
MSDMVRTQDHQVTLGSAAILLVCGDIDQSDGEDSSANVLMTNNLGETKDVKMCLKVINSSLFLTLITLYHLFSVTLSIELTLVYELDHNLTDAYSGKWQTNTRIEASCNPKDGCKKYDNSNTNLNFRMNETTYVVEFTKLSDAITGNYSMNPDAMSRPIRMINYEIIVTAIGEDKQNLSVNCSFAGYYQHSSCFLTKKEDTRGSSIKFTYEIFIKRFKINHSSVEEYKNNAWSCQVSMIVSDTTESMHASVRDERDTSVTCSSEAKYIKGDKRGTSADVTSPLLCNRPADFEAQHQNLDLSSSKGIGIVILIIAAILIITIPASISSQMKS